MFDHSCKHTSMVLKGRTLSPGMGQGRAFLYRDLLGRQGEFYDIEENDVKSEIDRFTKAIINVSADLNLLAKRVDHEIDSSLSGVFYAHINMVQDPSLKAEVEKEIKEEFVSAGTAVKTVFRRWERRFHQMEMEIAKHKADDIHDLARRLIASLAGIRTHALENLPKNSVLIAYRLLPSDTIYLARRNASAALLEYGGTGSHAALFAREIGLPCITGLTKLLESIPSKSPVLVNADAAEAIINSDLKQRTAFQRKLQRQTQTKQKALEQAHQPAMTEGGQTIAVYANVSCPDDTQLAIDNGADGIGLYRIEQIFLGCQTPPDAASLFKEIHQTLEPAKHLPVYVRLLDVGADKPLPFLKESQENNPALGLRGFRFLQSYPDLLQTQLNVLLRLSLEFNLHILVPMVTLPQDMKSAKQHLIKLASQLQISPVPQVGAMIETPAATLSLPQITKYADYLSFGTNDLTQYVFAADRENAAVEKYYDDAHDVIFRLFDIAHHDLPHCSFSVCGELAGQTSNVARLIKYGVNTLSVAPPLIPAIKQAIRQAK